MGQGKAIPFEREDLEELYWTHGLTTAEIADVFGCGWYAVCELRKEIRLLRWQVSELTKQIKGVQI